MRKSKLCALRNFTSILVTTCLLANKSQADNKESVAIIIGNKNYESTINVEYAHNDADKMQEFLIKKLGYELNRIRYLQDAKLGAMVEIFGNDRRPRGRLWHMVERNSSNVIVYYSGHGVKYHESGTLYSDAYLLPVDIHPNRAYFGLNLDTLERNLDIVKQKVGPDRTVILILDACFTGNSGGGVIQRFSATGPSVRPRVPRRVDRVIRISASGPDQVAHWDDEMRHGLFTGQFLKAVKGEADIKYKGDKNKVVTWSELAVYVRKEVKRIAHEKLNSDQTPQINESLVVPWRFSVADPESEDWNKVTRSDDIKSYILFMRRWPGSRFSNLARRRIVELGTATRKEGQVRFREGRFSLAGKLFKKAIAAGDRDANYWLGLLYETGKGRKGKDFSLAMKHYQAAADRLHAKSMMALGMLYDQGRGVVRSTEKASHWYRRAAKNGDGIAMNELGVLAYSNGKLEEAIKWWNQANEEGNSTAKINLALLYDRGFRRGGNIIVPSDTNASASYILDAYKTGHSYAAKLLEAGASSLTENTRKAIQRQLNEIRNYGLVIDGVLGRRTKDALLDIRKKTKKKKDE